MSSEEEVERFEVTDQDLRDAFYPGSRRKFTKEQAIYGMWADSDEDKSQRSSSKRSGPRKGKADYTGPMDFVSGGYTQKQEEDKEDESGSEEEDRGSSSCRHYVNHYVGRVFLMLFFQFIFFQTNPYFLE